MTVLVYDTETTGIYNEKLPPDHPEQPYIVQLGAQLYTDDGKRLLAQMDFMVHNQLPDNKLVVIPQIVTDIHGISTNDAIAFGIPMKSALTLFNGLVTRADVCVAHNGKFDRNVIETMALRIDRANCLSAVGVNHFCTMEALTPICKIPATPAMLRAGRGPYKPPKLIEAYRFLFNEDFEGAHNAMADVQACARIYFEIKNREHADA